MKKKTEAPGTMRCKDTVFWGFFVQTCQCAENLSKFMLIPHSENTLQGLFLLVAKTPTYTRGSRFEGEWKEVSFSLTKKLERLL